MLTRGNDWPVMGLGTWSRAPPRTFPRKCGSFGGVALHFLKRFVFWFTFGLLLAHLYRLLIYEFIGLFEAKRRPGRTLYRDVRGWVTVGAGLLVPNALFAKDLAFDAPTECRREAWIRVNALPPGRLAPFLRLARLPTPVPGDENRTRVNRSRPFLSGPHSENKPVDSEVAAGIPAGLAGALPSSWRGVLERPGGCAARGFPRLLLRRRFPGCDALPEPARVGLQFPARHSMHGQQPWELTALYGSPETR